MHEADDLPAAAPLTVTCCARPSEPNTTTARDGASSPATQWRAPLITEPSAAWTAPVVGLAGSSPPRLSAGRSAGSGGRSLPGAAAAWFGLVCGLLVPALARAVATTGALVASAFEAGVPWSGKLLGSMPRGAFSVGVGSLCATALAVGALGATAVAVAGVG